VPRENARKRETGPVAPFDSPRNVGKKENQKLCIERGKGATSFTSKVLFGGKEPTGRKGLRKRSKIASLYGGKSVRGRELPIRLRRVSPRKKMGL